MAVEKICGIETEYSIIHKGVEDQNPIWASSMLITSYVQDTEQGLKMGFPVELFGVLQVKPPVKPQQV